MNSKLRILSVANFSLAVGLLALPAYLFADTLYVTVKDSKLRKQPRVLSSAVASLRFGDELEMVEELEGWASAKTSRGQQGYVSLSAVSESKSGLLTKGERAGAGEDETTAAATGVSPEQMERAFLQGNPSADMAAVNRMERQYNVSESQLILFVKSGKLKIQE